MTSKCRRTGAATRTTTAAAAGTSDPVREQRAPSNRRHSMILNGNSGNGGDRDYGGRDGPF